MPFVQEIECPHCQKSFPVPKKRHYFAIRRFGGELQAFCDRAEELALFGNHAMCEKCPYQSISEETKADWNRQEKDGHPCQMNQLNRCAGELGYRRNTILPQAVAVIRKTLAALEQIDDLPPIYERERRRIAREAIEEAAELVKEK
jgi:hypothetical protein